MRVHAGKTKEPAAGDGGKNVAQQKKKAPESGINFTVQRKENKTGMPDHLKSGLENLSGHDLSDVRVHYNSPKPAQLNAHAYAQGNQIHLGPGQEKHLPHEGWHAVQQKQGRVKATTQLKAAPVQLYSTYGNDKNRMSDDGKMCVAGNATPNKLYADDSLIEPTNQALESKNAGARIKSLGNARQEGPTGNKKSLKPVKLVTADQSCDFGHEDACSDQAYKLMGTTEKDAYEGGSQQHIYKQALQHMVDQQHGGYGADVKQIDRSGAEREKARKDLGSNYMPFKTMYYRFIMGTETDLEEDWELVAKKIATKQHDTIPALIKTMKQVAQTGNKKFPAGFTEENIDAFEVFITAEDDTKALIGKHSPTNEVPGLNEKASPNVGEAYVIMSGGKNKKEELTWNYHWGTVTMKSGNDTVTTESYANTPTLMGVWSMYGTNKGQSFHEEHAATNLHGETPATMVTHVENGKLVMGNEPEKKEPSKKQKTTNDETQVEEVKQEQMDEEHKEGL